MGEDRRSEAPTTETHGKKVRQRGAKRKTESNTKQPREFQAPGTEVRK